MTNPALIVCRDGAELSRRAAEQFVASAAAAIEDHGRFTVALSGGSTPKALYELLASGEFSARVSWSRVHLFWGDERCVPPGHPESNFRMVREALIAKIEIPAANLHPMTGEKEPAAAAAQYEAQLRQFFQPAGGELPRFDLVLLGVGEDGHTASLFPGNAAVNERERWVAPAYVEKLKAHRLTLTLPVINNAAQISFLIAGQSKAPVVKEIFSGQNSNAPAALIKPANGKLSWLITHDAAGDLAIGQ